MILALFLIRPNQTVSLEQIVQELWGERPPQGPVKTIQVYVSRIRQSLDDGGECPLVSRPAGYELHVGAGELDTQVFVDLTREGQLELRHGNPARAAENLTSALKLYHGPALVGVPRSPRVDAEVARMEEWYLTAVEAHFDARLALGDGHELVAELRALTAQYPLREGLWARLMRGLHGSGRQAEALNTYLNVRRTLVEELGVEPGPELHSAHAEILNDHSGATIGNERSASPGLVIPRQLPPTVSGFAGRARNLADMDAITDGGDTEASGAARIVNISGEPGVGKTALATYWAHRVADRFPDGQLYVDLRAGTGTPSSDLALAQLLRSLGIAPAMIPAKAEERSALYRTLLSGKRVLILIDSAVRTAQVRPLLPGTSSCLTVVTSRESLSELIIKDGAVSVPLRALEQAEALGLLRGLIGRERLAAEREAVLRLIELTGGMPLALRRAAADIARSPERTLRYFVAESEGRCPAKSRDLI